MFTTCTTLTGTDLEQYLPKNFGLPENSPFLEKSPPNTAKAVVKPKAHSVRSTITKVICDVIFFMVLYPLTAYIILNLINFYLKKKLYLRFKLTVPYSTYMRSLIRICVLVSLKISLYYLSILKTFS